MLSLVSARYDADKSGGASLSIFDAGSDTRRGHSDGQGRPPTKFVKSASSSRRSSPTKNTTTRISLPNRLPTQGCSGSHTSIYQGNHCNPSREPSVSRLSGNDRDYSNTPNTASSRESTGRDSNISRNTSSQGVSSPGRYFTLPRSSKLSVSHKICDNVFNDDKKFGVNVFTEMDNRDIVVSHIALNSRQGAETPPSRFAGRKPTSTSNRSQVSSYASNSLPRHMGKSHQHPSSSITDSSTERKIHEAMLKARTFDREIMLSKHGFDRTNVGPECLEDAKIFSLLAATRQSMVDQKYSGDGEPRPSRAKSESFSQAVDLNDMYASLPLNLATGLDSSDVFNPQRSEDIAFPLSGDPRNCVGDCKKFLNVSLRSSCLCHLLKRRPEAFIDDNHDETPTSSSSATGVTEAEDDPASDDAISEQLDSASVMESRDLETNARINALETSLKNLMSRMTGQQMHQQHQLRKSLDSELSLQIKNKYNSALKSGSDGDAMEDSTRRISDASEFSFIDNMVLKHNKDNETFIKRDRNLSNEHTNHDRIHASINCSSELVDAKQRVSASILELQNSRNSRHRLPNRNSEASGTVIYNNKNDFVSMTAKHRSVGNYNLNRSSLEYPYTQCLTAGTENKTSKPSLPDSSQPNLRQSTKSAVDSDRNLSDAVFAVPACSVPVSDNSNGTNIAPITTTVADLSAISLLDDSRFEPNSASSIKSSAMGGAREQLSAYKK